MKAPRKPKGEPKRKAVPPAVPLDDDDDNEYAPPEAVDELEDMDLERAARELGAGDASGRVWVTKLEPKDKAGECCSYPVSEYSIERLRDDWGDGKYLIVIRRASGAIYTKGTVQLAPRAVRPVAQTVDVDAIKRQVRDEQAPTIDLLKSIAMTALGRPAAPATDPLQLLEVLERVQKLAAPRERGGELDAIMKGIKLATDLRGSGGAEGAGLGDVAVEFLRSWRTAQENPQATAAPPAPPAPANHTALAATPATDEARMQLFVTELIGKQVGIFLKGAEEGTDPGVYAQLLLDQVPEQFFPLVVEQLSRPDWFEQLFKLDPRVQPHREWLAKLREQFIAAISPAAPPSP